ncbi:hypothetical protein ACNHKD_01515 [Methylocystis sp. JAN1]|uniref:hypothetical protein n=1 Tax=Methylocystis sp. JAN1 TaxID=3397211 RepID=UPI003FA1F736
MLNAFFTRCRNGEKRIFAAHPSAAKEPGRQLAIQARVFSLLTPLNAAATAESMPGVPPPRPFDAGFPGGRGESGLLRNGRDADAVQVSGAGKHGRTRGSRRKQQHSENPAGE